MDLRYQIRREAAVLFTKYPLKTSSILISVLDFGLSSNIFLQEPQQILREAYSRNDIKAKSVDRQKLSSPAGAQLKTTRTKFLDGVTVQLAAEKRLLDEKYYREDSGIIPEISKRITCWKLTASGILISSLMGEKPKQ